MLLSVLYVVLMVAKYTDSSVDVIHGRETRLTIDLDVISSNYQALIDKLPPNTPVMVVVKANASGLGSVGISYAVLALGAKYLAVAIIDEGVYLRKHGITAPILILGYTSAYGKGIELAIKYDLTINVFSLRVLNAVQRKAVKYNSNPVKIHIKVNTGLNRLGLKPDELVPFVAHIKNRNYTKIMVEGVFSQFCCIRERPVTSFAKNYSFKQLNTFKRVVREARKVLHIPIAHMANSGAIDFLGENAIFDMVRSGSSIMGFFKSAKFPMSLTSIISSIVKPAEAEVLGYSQHVRSNGSQWIAVIPIGYADGLKIECSHQVGDVLIKGKRVPIVSGIMMDQMLVDVTSVYPVKVGDEVVVFGQQLGAEITIQDYVKKCGGTAKSFTTQLSRRLPRVYLENGKTVYFENVLIE